jgi:hypothetical protein
MSMMERIDAEIGKKDAEIERLKGLLTRVMVSEGRCPTSLMQDIRAALAEDKP